MHKHIHEGEFIAKFPLVPGHETVGVVAAKGKVRWTKSWTAMTAGEFLCVLTGPTECTEL